MVLSAVGLRLFIRLASLAWKKFIAPTLGLGIDVTSQGRWAVVTGATDGLGKAYAEALAAKGLDVLLISRSLTKLQNVAENIKQRFGNEVRILEADLTQGQPVYAKIATSIEELEVSVSILLLYYIIILGLDHSIYNNMFSWVFES